MDLKITKIKLQIAKILYFFVKLFYKSDKQVANRGGINFELYLNEGIDLHVFIFGGFQKYVYQNKLVKIAPDDTVFDVGANIGIMSLFFAKQASAGCVHAFEPTYYAIEKFRKNMQLNPELSELIVLNQCFVSSQNMENTDLVAYSSWPIGGMEKKHSIHCGVAKNTEKVSSITLDDYVVEKNIQKLNLIKIDTDGYELNVLKGAQIILKSLRPTIIFEIGIYIMQEHNVAFSDYYSLFHNNKYALYTAKGKIITDQNFQKHIPRYGTIDVIAIPLLSTLPN